MFNCLGSSLVRDVKSRLLVHGAGQRKVAGQKAAISAAKAISHYGEATIDRDADRLAKFTAWSAIARNSNPTGAGYGMPNMRAAAGLGATIPGRVSSNYRGIPDTSARYRTWYDRAYGPPPVPGLGLDFGSLLPAGGGAGGLLSMFVKSPEQKAAEKAAKAQEAAAKAQVKAAKIAAQSDADRQAGTQRLLLIGGGVVLAAGLGYLLLRKKG